MTEQSNAFLADILAPLTPYINNHNAVEVMVNRPGQVLVEVPGEGVLCFEDSTLTLGFFEQLGRVFSNRQGVVDFEKTPFLATWLPDGHRLQLCLGNSVQSGVALSIRIWRPRAFKLSDYRISERYISLIGRAVDERWNILVSGGMFSGKTTLTNAIIESIAPTQRVISVEDTPELDLSHLDNRTQFVVARLTTAEDIDYNQVLRAIQRLRPDRTLIGELSDQNTALLSRLLNMGHAGTLATLHADSPELAFSALQTNAALSGMAEYGAHAAAEVFRQKIDLIIQIERLPNYDRVVTEVYVGHARKSRLVDALVFDNPQLSNAEIIDDLLRSGVSLREAELDGILDDLGLQSIEQRTLSLRHKFHGREHALSETQKRAMLALA